MGYLPALIIQMINKVICDDAIKVMQGMEGDSVDGCVCDPPYGLEFMGKEWDRPGKYWDKRKGDPEKHPTGKKWSEEMGCQSGNKGFAGMTKNPSMYQAGLSYQHWTTQWATELYRILKPGAYLLAFGGTRTVHRLTCGIEDAGFIVRDKIAWVYGSGFPKNYDVSKGFDKREGAEREVVGERPDFVARRPKKNFEQFTSISPREKGINSRAFVEKMGVITAPATPLAKQWSGFGTALKPAHEDIIIAQKPLDKNYCYNLEKWACGAMNIERGRINYQSEKDKRKAIPGGRITTKVGEFAGRSQGSGKDSELNREEWKNKMQGRWPANLILECCCDEVVEGKQRPERVGKKGGNKGALGAFAGSTSEAIGKWPADKQIIHTNPDCPCYMLDEESEPKMHNAGYARKNYTISSKGVVTNFCAGSPNGMRFGDSGGASRFFRYIPKASRSEREAGLKGRLPCVKCGEVNSDTHLNDKDQRVNCIRNDHPTVKPIRLFQELQGIFTPPGGITIDPFAGSGSSCISAIREGLRFIAIDQDSHYCDISKARVQAELEKGNQGKLFR